LRPIIPATPRRSGGPAEIDRCHIGDRARFAKATGLWASAGEASSAMPWTNQSGGGGGGPWGGGPSPWGRGPQGPKVEDIIKRSQDKLRGVLPGGFGSAPGIVIILAIALALWGLSGFYQVQPDELGVVLRFGAIDRIAPPGLRYHLP